MFREFALEPELVATWGDPAKYRFFRGSFEVGKGRLVSHYPKSWPRLVYELAKDCDPVEKKRIEELLTDLKKVSVRRPGSIYDDTAAWIENALKEHDRVPFGALLARSRGSFQGPILVAEEVEHDTPVWRSSTGASIPRTTAALADVVKTLLRSSRQIIFVDPHLSPAETPKRVRAIEGLLAALSTNRIAGPPTRVEFHMSQWKGGTAENFQRECNSCAQRIPLGMTVRFVRWKESEEGLRLHNRYILTELGGVQLAHGLDEGQLGEEDDVHILDREQYQRRWAQYAGDDLAFAVHDTPVDVSGSAQPKPCT